MIKRSITEGLIRCPAPFSSATIFSGTTTNPASAAAWNWLVIAGVTQPTNFNNSPPAREESINPGSWLMWTRRFQPRTMCTPPTMTLPMDPIARATPASSEYAVSYGVNPPNFTVDNQSGTATGSINPGHRLAVDPRNGFVYSLIPAEYRCRRLEVRKISTTCLTAPRMAAPHGR